MKRTLCFTFVVMFVTGISLLAQESGQKSESSTHDRENQSVKFVASDFTSQLGTGHVRPPKLYVVSRKLKDGSSELTKVVYFPKFTPRNVSYESPMDSFIESISSSSGWIDVVLREPTNKETNHCTSFSNFVEVDASKAGGSKNDKTLRFVSLEYKASMMFEFVGMKCFILESLS